MRIIEKLWKIFLRIWEELKIFFISGERSELKLEDYIDSSFQSDPDNSKSILEYVFTLNDGEVSWKSFKQ